MINNPEYIFVQNKYLNLYNSIINKAKQRPIYKKAQRRINYVEDHHIIPKSFGGSNDISNLVQLTAREHYIVHQLLPKFTLGLQRSKMLFAFELMNKMGAKINSRTFERYKLIFSENQKNKIVTQETRDKIGKAGLGRKNSPETIAKRKESFRKTMSLKEPKPKIIKEKKIRQYIHLSDEHKLKVSQTLKKRNELNRIDKIGVSKVQFHKIAVNCKSIKELQSKFPNLKSHTITQTIKSWYGTNKFHEAFNKPKTNLNETKRFKKLGVKDFKEFESIAKQCNTLEEFNNSFSCDSKYLRKCLGLFYGNSSFYKIFNKERTFSKETKTKMALAKIGTKRTEETKAKLSLNHKSKRYGISKETCEKISKANKGKISSMKGKKHSKETILKMKNRDSNINERIGLKNKEINEIKRLEKLGIKSKEQFIKLGKKCKTLDEFRNHFNCEWSYVEKCLKHWFNSSSFYKAFEKSHK